MFTKLATLISVHPRKVILLWLVVFAIAQPFSWQVSEVLSSEIDSVPNSVAKKVNDELQKEFDARGGFQVILVAEFSGDALASDAYYAQLKAELLEREDVLLVNDFESSSTLPFTLADNQSIATLHIKADSWLEAQSHAGALQEFLDEWSPSKAERLILTGGAALEYELQHIAEADARRAEMFGLPLSLIVLIIVFGALVAASLPLLVAALSISISLGILFLFGQFMTIATYASIVITMLGLATGIDYALLIVNRFREELRQSDDKVLAAQRTTLSAGKAVFSSGATVIIALASLLLPPTQFIRSIGIGGIAVLSVSVLISISLLPAVLCLLGNKVNALSFTGAKAPGTRTQSFWQSWSVHILQHPWVWTLGALVLLIVLSLPMLDLEVKLARVEGITEGSQIRQAQAILAESGLEGLLQSHQVLIDFDEQGFFHPASYKRVADISRAFVELEGVESVVSATTAPAVPSLLMQQYYIRQDIAMESPLADLVEASVSNSGRYTLIQVFPDISLSRSALQEMVAQMDALLQEENLDYLIGGDYVAEWEWMRSVYRVFPWAIALVYIATFFLLALSFKSILIPIKSILLNTLTVSSALGVITLVFQNGYVNQLIGLSSPLGYVDSVAPIFIFAVVFGISMDYEVFLVARIYEAHQQGKSDSEAVVYALTRTGSVITSAASIMVIVFASFLFSNIITVKTLSLGLSIAVLLDASVVRVMLVPAAMILAGKWNWWFPKPLERLSRRLQLGHDA